MTTERLQVSILAAPLAAMDRRTLSQAWYSVLHLERRQTRTSATALLRSKAGPAGTPPPRSRSAVASIAPEVRRSEPKREAKPPAHAEMPARDARRETIHSVPPLSRRIERTFSRTGGTVRRATFSLGRGRARVHVILQSHAGTVTLVALCRPEMRVEVARALARARLALAARGFHVATPAEGGSSCF